MKGSLAALTLSLYGCTVPVVESVNAVDQMADSPNSKELVINGYEGAYEDFPAIGAFVYPGGNLSRCTVSLLRKDLALTAAHCINPDGLNQNGLGESDPRFVLHGRNEVFPEYF